VQKGSWTLFLLFGSFCFPSLLLSWICHTEVTDLIQILQRLRDKLRIHHDISLHISSYLFTFLESQLRQECLYGSSMKCRSKASKASKP
jgi:hypothetical protein